VCVGRGEERRGEERRGEERRGEERRGEERRGERCEERLVRRGEGLRFTITRHAHWARRHITPRTLNQRHNTPPCHAHWAATGHGALRLHALAHSDLISCVLWISPPQSCYLPEALEALGVARGGEGRGEVGGAHDLRDRGRGMVLLGEEEKGGGERGWASDQDSGSKHPC
jgi:hypothetical protein